MKKENRMNMNIRKSLGTSVLSVALLLASGIPALAKDSRTVTLTHDVVLNGTSLPAAQYAVRWETHSPEATVKIVRDGKVVSSTDGRVEERSNAFERNVAAKTGSRLLDGHYNPYDFDAVVYNTAPDGTISLMEIRFAHSNKVLVFNQ
jgi:hypothetical protein